MKDVKIDRVKGHLDLLLLGVLEREAGHGYAVITALRERTDGMLDLTEGAVYPALHRLEDLGLLAERVAAGRRPAPAPVPDHAGRPRCPAGRDP